MSNIMDHEMFERNNKLQTHLNTPEYLCIYSVVQKNLPTQPTVYCMDNTGAKVAVFPCLLTTMHQSCAAADPIGFLCIHRHVFG